MNMKKQIIKNMALICSVFAFFTAPVFAVNHSWDNGNHYGQYKNQKYDVCEIHGYYSCRTCEDLENQKNSYLYEYEYNKSENDKKHQNELKKIEDQKKVYDKKYQDELKKIEELKKALEKEYQANLKKINDAKNSENKRYSTLQKKYEDAKNAAEKKYQQELKIAKDEHKKYQQWLAEEELRRQEEERRNQYDGNRRVPSVAPTQNTNRREAYLIN